jgi:hypothetical protein
MSIDSDMISELRKSYPEKIAKEICDVQPITGNIDWNKLAEGYSMLAQYLVAHNIDPILPVVTFKKEVTD